MLSKRMTQYGSQDYGIAYIKRSNFRFVLNKPQLHRHFLPSLSLELMSRETQAKVFTPSYRQKEFFQFLDSNFNKWKKDKEHCRTQYKVRTATKRLKQKMNLMKEEIDK